MKLTGYISLYNGVVDAKSTKRILTTEALERIAADDYKKAVEAIRAQSDKTKRDTLKKKLQAVTWSGEFTERKKSALIRHSGLICLDFDGLSAETLAKAKEAAKKSPYVFAAFVSPSGNGIKILFRVSIYTGATDMDPENEMNFEHEQTAEKVNKEHELWWRALATYAQKQFMLTADESGKDSSRLCFMSYDPDLYIAAEPVTITLAQRAQMLELDKAPSATTVEAEFLKIREYTNKKKPFDAGRNDHIYFFACNANRKGIPFAETLSYLRTEYSHFLAEEGDKQFNDSVESAYKNHQSEHGAFKKSFGSNYSYTATRGETRPESAAPKYNEAVLFYYSSDKVDKKGEPVVDEKTGEVIQEYKFDYDGLTYFLANNGFRKIRLGERGYQFVRTNGLLLEAVEPAEINDFINDYLTQHVKPNAFGLWDVESIIDPLQGVRRMYKRNLKNYTNPANYNTLPPIAPKFQRDTRDAGFLYFKNGYLKISKDGRSFHAYGDLKESIWLKQRRDFSFTHLEHAQFEECDVWQFLRAAIVQQGKRPGFENYKGDSKDLQRMEAVITGIGYLIDTYKDPANSKAVVFGDKHINPSRKDAHGGTGKSLTAKIISKMINACMLDGKAFKFDDAYPFETLRADHKLIVFNDVNWNFAFDRLFHKLTEDFEYKKKYVDAIVIPYEDSPKALIITNYSLQGEGNSYARRQHFIEFSNYFCEAWTVQQEIGRRMFDDWDEAEWNRFYNFIAFCVQQFKLKGLVPFPAVNKTLNKLVLAAGEEFIDYMDMCFIGDAEQNAKPTIGLDKRVKRDELFDGLREIRRYRNLENTNSFSAWVKMWAEERNLEINAHKNGGNDKSGATYYYTFTPMEAAANA